MSEWRKTEPSHACPLCQGRSKRRLASVLILRPAGYHRLLCAAHLDCDGADCGGPFGLCACGGEWDCYVKGMGEGVGRVCVCVRDGVGGGGNVCDGR